MYCFFTHNNQKKTYNFITSTWSVVIIVNFRARFLSISLDFYFCIILLDLTEEQEMEEYQYDEEAKKVGDIRLINDLSRQNFIMIIIQRSFFYQ